MTIQKNTPMMEQYLSIKNDYPDSILFYRMGDFYEMFLDDAEKAAGILEIALTSRNKNQEIPIPMCGVPHRAADTYIAKLIDHGCKVAVCEQVEDPALAKGLVRREVVRVVTPGMILNETLLDKTTNNFILALSVNEGYAGLSYLDISTGIFRVTQANSDKGRIPSSLIDEALRVDANEILLPEPVKSDPSFNTVKKAFHNRHISYISRHAFTVQDAKERLVTKFKTRSLEGFGCEHLTAGIAAAGAILFYVQETQLQETYHITTLEHYELSHYLMVDDRSCRNLELLKNIQSQDKKGTLISILDKTVTAMGGRLLKSWIRYPLIDIKAINERLICVEEALNNRSLRNSLRGFLKEIYDIERIGSKISMGQANARDLIALKTSLFKLPQLFEGLSQFSSHQFALDRYGINPDDPSGLMELAQHIHAAIREDAPMTLNDGGIIQDGYHAELDKLIEMSRNGKRWIAEAGAKEKEETGLSSLKIKYNKVFGYFLEVSKNQASQVPDHYIRKQTLVNAERFITEALKTAEMEVMTAQERRVKLEYELFVELRDTIITNAERIRKTANFIATVDCLLCLAQCADENNYIKPELNHDQIIDIQDGRHPVVEKMIVGERYVPNSIHLNNQDQQILIITGPNMAGKSTVLRQVALSVLMAQIGSFIPAKKASLCIIDRIFTRVGALDNLSQGQSTFMVEMEETANIINNATDKSLVILDEIGRGTSTFDGMSIAWAVAEHLHDLDGKGVKTLFATHYHELTRLSETKERVRNLNIAVKEFRDNIIFLRRLIPGATNKSYGIQVARLAGIPDTVVGRAKEILAKIESKPGQVEPDLKERPEPGQKQLDLFVPDVMDKIRKEITSIDLASTTPIEALNLLNNIQQQLNQHIDNLLCRN